MKKHVLFYLVFVFLAINARAQQNTLVTIGTGTAASSNFGPIVVNTAAPTNYFSQHIALYSAAEINATPFMARALTKIAWYKEDTARYNTTGGAIKIYLKQTSATAIAGGPGGANWNNELTGAVQVYNVNMPGISSGAGWKEFALPAPFIWDGVSNLEVLVDWTGSGTITNTLNWRYTFVTGNQSATTASPFPGIPLGGNRPNLQLTFTAFNNDGGISALTPVSPVAPNVSMPVKATLKNFGANAITTATVGWKVNGVAQADYTWNGNLASGQTDGNLTLGNFTFPIGAHTVKAYTKTINGATDPFKTNDTLTTQLVACSALSGNYTINKNAAPSATNFQSFNSAALVLNTCGVSGAVIITVAPGTGPYNESVVLNQIPGTDATKTVTFEGNGNTITSANLVVFKLNNADRVKLNNLVVTNTNTGLISAGVQLINNSDFFTLSNCTINVPQIFGNNIVGVLLTDGPSFNQTGNFSNNSLFENNIINGGQYGIRMHGQAGVPAGSAPTGAVNNRFVNNQIRDSNSTGIYLHYADGTKIEGNTFSRPTRPDGGGYVGIQFAFSSISFNTIISKNRFHNTHGAANATTITGGATGIAVEAAAAAGSENIIKNNLFYNFNNQGAINVINVGSTASFLNVYNNTISIEDPTRPATNASIIRAFTAPFGSGANVKFVNNIVTINTPGTGAKHAIYLGAPLSATFVSNNNVLHIASGQTNAHTGFLTSNRTTLTDWRAANTAAPFDMNSVDSNPAFTNLATGDLKPTSPDVNNVGQPLAAVTDDILGVTRSTTTPDPGAYEFSPAVIDAGITAFVSPTTPALPGVALPVQVTLKNFSTGNLSSAPIGWKVNGVMQPVYNWTGSIGPNATTTFTIGNHTFAAGTYTVCAWTALPNDANKANDSTCTVINACASLTGNYTINKNAPASATNFQTFTAAATTLHNCGVSGKVTISVVSGTGPYTEFVNLQSIPGASAVNRVIFQGNGNTLTGLPTNQTPTLFKLDNADFVKINNLNLVLGTNTQVVHPTFSALQLVNQSENDTISNCTITTQQTNTSMSTVVVGILAGTDVNQPGNNTRNSVFMNNTITGGFYSIKLIGNAGATDAMNNRIIGNTILDSNGYGIALENTDANLVDGNTITLPTLANPQINYYAISLAGANKNATISKNRIHTFWGNYTGQIGNAYGFHISGAGAPAGSENKFVNNLIENTNTPQYFYGIYNDGSDGNYFYHNTIISNMSGGFYGYYQTNTFTANNKFNNNIISVPTSDSFLNNTAIHFAGDPIETNNNVFYLAPGVANIRYGFFQNVAYITLATWKAAFSNAFDQQSVDANPVFLNVGVNNPVPSNPAVNNIGKPLPAVPTDMLGNARNAATPDPGAYEFTPSIANTAVIAINSPVTNCGLTNQETVTITIKNLAGVTPASVPVSFQVDGGTPVVESFTGTLPFNTTATYTFTAKANLSAPGSHRILVKTLLPGDTDLSNDTMSVKVITPTQASLPVAFNFETAATGIAAMRLVTNTNSAITEGAGASNGTGSTKGMIMDGVDNANWVPGTSNTWIDNPQNFAGAYVCLSTANTNPTDTLRLRFDLKQLFKASNANTNFRVTVNGTQVGPTYRPPFSGTPIVWQKIVVDLSAYLTQSTIQVGLESSVKEAYANGAGTANLIDNIEFVRTAGPTTGVKDHALQANVVVYPNPSTGLFHVTLPQGKAYELTVTDLSGKAIRKQAASAGTSQLNLEGTAKGIYLLRVSGENGSAVRKLIVE